MGGERPLTSGEVALVRAMFGDAIDTRPVTIRRRKWFWFQPKRITMAPRGHIHFHPHGDAYCDDFAHEPLIKQAFFLHEMTHVWQAQVNGPWFLLRRRMPFARYDYAVRPGWPLTRYGIEQQAEIVRHTFLLRNGYKLRGAPPLEQLESILPFSPDAPSA